MIIVAGQLQVDPEERDGYLAVEAFRGSGPSGPQQEAIRSAAVWQHQIASSERL